MVYIQSDSSLPLPILHLNDSLTSVSISCSDLALSSAASYPPFLLGVGYRHTHEPSSVLRLETQVLSLEMSGLGVLSNLSHSVLSPLVGWQGIINCLSVFGSNSILLSEISLLDDRIGKLLVRII